MKKRTLPFSCENHACQHLSRVIQHYAHTAFPIGGSECAQASREALLALAHRLEHCTAMSLPINPRQAPMLKAAIKWYFSEIETDQALQARLLQQLQRQKPKNLL